MFIYLLLILLTSIYLLHILRYDYYWKKFLANTNLKAGNSIVTHYISVIIIARNEEAHIVNCINHLLKQNYLINQFEIIVVDDFSEDSTIEKIKSIQNEKIKLISLCEILDIKHANTANKKMGISIAIKEAKGSIIACSDADALTPTDWLNEINHAFQNSITQYVTGPVLYENNGTFIEQFQTIDMYSMIGITAASIQMDIPYMSNGANMAFRKDSFKQVGGYLNIDHLPTGDDVLLMHKIHDTFKSNSIQFLHSTNSVVTTYAEKSFQGFFQQRTRWVSKSTSYSKVQIKITLAFMYLFHLSLLISPFILFYLQKNFYVYVSCFLIKLIIDTIFINKICQHLNKKYNVFLMPIFEIVYICYISIIGMSASYGSYHWKNRNIKKNQ